MLALKTSGFVSILSRTAARNASGSRQMAIIRATKTPNCQHKQSVAVPINFIGNTAIAPFAFTSTRFFTSRPPPTQSTSAKSSSTSSPSTSSSSPSTSSSSTNSSSSSSSATASALSALPDKEQVEKYLFKTIAIVWDASVWTYDLTTRNFDKYIIKNPTVQMYWKEFLEKLEKARKN